MRFAALPTGTPEIVSVSFATPAHVERIDAGSTNTAPPLPNVVVVVVAGSSVTLDVVVEVVVVVVEVVVTGTPPLGANTASKCEYRFGDE